MTRRRLAAWRAVALMEAEQKYDHSAARQEAIDALVVELEAEEAECRESFRRQLSDAEAQVMGNLRGRRDVLARHGKAVAS